jgi:fructokinase
MAISDQILSSLGSIICLGEVLWDIFPGKSRSLGGAPTNTCFHCLSLGHPTALVSAVGKDQEGDAILQKLQQFGIATNWVYPDKNLPTGKAVVKIDPEGNPSYRISKKTAWDRILWSKDLERLTNNAQVVCFGTLAQRHSVSRETIQRFLASCRNARIRLLDLNLRGTHPQKCVITESLALSNMAKLNRPEFEIVCKIAGIESGIPFDMRAQSIRQAFDLQILWITLGADGSMLATPKETLCQPAIQCPVIDTVGAGDAFCAGLLCGLSRNYPLPVTTRLATHLAARACSHQGAIPQI